MNCHCCFLSDHLENNPEDQRNENINAAEAKGTHSLEIHQTQRGYLKMENLSAFDAVVQ